MPITFTQDERIALSRRLVKIPIENSAYIIAKDNADAAQLIFQNVDNGNKEFFDFYSGIVSNYEGEAQEISDDIRTTFDEDDVYDSATQANPNIFYPVSAPFNYFLNPMIGDAVNGGVSGPASTSEAGAIDAEPSAESPSGNGIIQLVDLLVTGFNHGAGSVVLASDYDSGDTAVVTDLPLGAGVGEYILISGSGTACIVVVTAIVGVNITVYPVTTFSGSIAFAFSTVTRVFPGFSGANRRSLTATVGAYQDILDSLTTSGSNSLISKAAEWSTSITAQLDFLDDNEEDRATQITQIATAVTNCNTAQTAIGVWQALSNTGVGGKFDDSPITTFQTAATTKSGQAATRLTQIGTALGLVVDNLDGTYTYTGADDELYYLRYRWLDVRINRTLGSLTRAINSARGSSNLQTVIDNNTFLFTAYQRNIVATRFTEDADGTNYLMIDDVSLFSIGDNCYIKSEITDEFAVTIQDIAGGTITLNIDVPIGYNREDLARIYKVF